jgi:hypothetical protein
VYLGESIMRIKAFTRDELLAKKSDTKLFVEFLRYVKNKEERKPEDVAFAYMHRINDEEFTIIWKDHLNKELAHMPEGNETFKFESIPRNGLFIVGPHQPKLIAYITTPTQAEKDILFNNHLPPKYTDMKPESTVKDIPDITDEQAEHATLIYYNGKEDTNRNIPNEDKELKHNMIVIVPTNPSDPGDRRTYKYRIRIRQYNKNIRPLKDDR